MMAECVGTVLEQRVPMYRLERSTDVDQSYGYPLIVVEHTLVVLDRTRHKKGNVGRKDKRSLSELRLRT